MLLFLTASICASAIIFAGIPAAVNNANRIHIENGREPNAGIAFMPELIVMIGILWGIGATLKYFLDLPLALITILVISTILFIWQIILARNSNREYATFVAEHTGKALSSAKEKNPEAQQAAASNGDKRP